jgi:hypothetical protein
VENLKAAVDAVLRLLMQIGIALAALLTGLELWLRQELQRLGVPHAAQTVILIVVTALLILGSLRLFGGLLRFAAVLILVLIVLDLVVPVLQG